jgi:RNA polymerase sigma factor for flagellar operon FliA
MRGKKRVKEDTVPDFATSSLPLPKQLHNLDPVSLTPSEIIAPEITGASKSAIVPGESLSPAEREQLLLEHMPSVRFVARRIHERLPQHVEMDDLISAGVVGLLDAFQKFDSTKNVLFKSYAQFRIRGAILDSLRDMDWGPRELRRKGRAIETAIHLLSHTLGRAPSEQEIAAQMRMTLASYQHLLGDLKGLEIGTLNVARNEDSGDDEITYLPGPESHDPLLQCLQGEMRERLADAIDHLPERERLVLTLYYYEELTMKEIGLTLGVVESRVSQLHCSAILRVRSALAAGASRKAAGDNKTSGRRAASTSAAKTTRTVRPQSTARRVPTKEFSRTNS